MTTFTALVQWVAGIRNGCLAKNKVIILDFELTRHENDEQLLSKIDSIKTAENIQILIPFAKAYLGLFYVIDSELAAKDKIKLLANSELAEAIFDGFLSALNIDNLPSIENIGQAAAQKKEFAEGYVVLAGLDLVAKKSLIDITKLEKNIIEKAVGFHFSNKSDYKDIWFDYLFIEEKKLIIPAITRYWVAMLKNNARFLPGINFVLGDKPDIQLIQHSILPLLENWHHCKAKILLQLLHLAFKYSEKNSFLHVCETILAQDESLSEKTRLYWLAVAYLISADKYFSRLSAYIGRVKLKIMPLLDFVVLILDDKSEININFSAKTVTQLLRMIAPVFPPQHHVYGALGELDINSRNVMLLFYYLACANDTDVINQLKSLRKARVMKIYSVVIDNLIEIHVRKKNDKKFMLPDFNEYIKTLVNTDCLQGRSNKFDLR